MNPHAIQPISLAALSRSLWSHRALIFQLTRRDISGTYKGSFLGIAWSIFTPILLLAVYTFVFSEIFNARWGNNTGNIPQNKIDFAIILFTGMIAHNFISEIINKSASIILINQNYVKKVIFPIEILGAVTVCTAFFHYIISLLILTLTILLFKGFLLTSMLWIPVIITPLVLIALGISWILGSIGVFVRDISQSTGLISTVLMFLSPVFYPISSLPEKYQIFMYINPLTFFIEETRAALIFEKAPNTLILAIYFTGSIAFAWFGFAWFQKTRKGFADVL